MSRKVSSGQIFIFLSWLGTSGGSTDILCAIHIAALAYIQRG